jgi:hypothetical protein
VTAWLRRGAAAAGIASERSDLWPAGALASLAYLGWLPLVLAVAPPRVSDVADLAVSLYSSGTFPGNVVALAVAAVGTFMLLCLLAAVGEAAVTRALRTARLGAADGNGSDAGEAALSGLAVILLACVPVVLACAWLLLGAVDTAPGIYTAPGPDDAVIPRLAASLMPQLVAVGVALLVAQAVGGRLLRGAIAASDDRIGSAVRTGLRDLGGAPWRWLGVAAAGWLKDALFVLGAWALLRALWGEIADSFGPGLVERPQALALLVGFVTIWLVLLLAGGALHAFISAWWLLEEGEGR